MSQQWHHHTHRTEGSFWTGFGLSTGCLLGAAVILVGLPVLMCSGLLLLGLIGSAIDPQPATPRGGPPEAGEVEDLPQHGEPDERFGARAAAPAIKSKPTDDQPAVANAVIVPPALIALTTDALSRYAESRLRGDRAAMKRMREHGVAADVDAELPVFIESRRPGFAIVRPTAGDLADRSWIVAETQLRGVR